MSIPMKRSPSHGGYGSDPSTVPGGVRNKNVRPGMSVGSSAPESALRAALSGGFDRPPPSSSSNNKINSNNSTNEAHQTPHSSSSTVTNADKLFTDTNMAARMSLSTAGLAHGSSPKRNKSPNSQAGPGSATKKTRSRSSSTESQNNRGGKKGSSQVTPQKSRLSKPFPSQRYRG